MPATYDDAELRHNSLNQQSTNKTGRTTGRVVEDKKPNSREIKVYIKDYLPCYSGDLKPLDVDQQVSGGGSFQGQIRTTNYVVAEWMGDESNRRFPPDVKKNEQVEIIIYYDQDKIFWRSLGRDDDKRRTERFEINAANTPNGPAPINRENSYSFTMDTQDKQEVNIQTSKTNGEPFAYVVKINAKDGKLYISDDDNNEFIMESGVPRLYMRNSDGSMLEIAKKNVTIVAPEDWLVKVGRQAIWDIPALTMVNNKKGGVTVWEAGQVAFKAQSFIINAPCIGLKGAVEANNIVSGNHYATGYSTIQGAAMGRMAAARSMAMQVRSKAAASRKVGFSTYAEPAINIFNGAVTKTNNTPNMDGGFTTNRHCTAWEDISRSVALIAQDLIKIDGVIGYGNNASGINAAAEIAIMNLNTGE